VEEGNRTKDLLSAFQFVPGDTGDRGAPSVPRLRPSFETPEDSSGKPALPALSAMAAVSRLLDSKF
jgi:hypothetical protein